MIEQAVTATQNEPVLINAIVVGAGLFVLWIAHTILQVRDGVKSLTTAIFGDENSKEDDGIKGDITETKRVSVANTKQIDEHIAEELLWRHDNAENLNNQNNRVHRQLQRIERKLGVEE